MVDVWLIFCIGITFVVIIYHAIVDSVANSDSAGASLSPVVPKLSYVRPFDKNMNYKLPHGPKFPKINAHSLVLFTKITTPLVFFIFNICYWGYIFSNKISGY